MEALPVLTGWVIGVSFTVMLALAITAANRHVYDVKLHDGRTVQCVTVGGWPRSVSCDWGHAR